MDENSLSKCGCYFGSYFALSKLEEGSQAKVYLAKQDQEDRLYAIKVYKHGNKTILNMLHEAKVLSLIDHCVIMKPVEICVEQFCKLSDTQFQILPFIVMDYCENGDLRHFLKAAPFPVGICNGILKIILEAVQKIHECSIIHRDLKPENILITDLFQLKIGDFGQAVETDRILKELVGSEPFIAPQVYSHYNYSPKSDIFSLGVLYFMLSTGMCPFKKARITDPLFNLLVQKSYDRFWPRIKTKCNNLQRCLVWKNVIYNMLAYKPEDRHSISQLLAIVNSSSCTASVEEISCFFKQIKSNLIVA